MEQRGKRKEEEAWSRAEGTREEERKARKKARRRLGKGREHSQHHMSTPVTQTRGAIQAAPRSELEKDENIPPYQSPIRLRQLLKLHRVGLLVAHDLDRGFDEGRLLQRVAYIHTHT
jgi:hypothetical protein